MGRTCDNCGARMAPFLPRTRLEDGTQVCKGCANRSDTSAPVTRPSVAQRTRVEKTSRSISPHYRVLVLDRSEEVPIVTWSGHDPVECMTNAMEEHQDPDTVHVYIDRLVGVMDQPRVIWQDGKITEHFAAKTAAEEDRSAVYVVNVPGQEGFHPTIQWDDSFGKWVCSDEGGRYATGNSPQVVLRTVKGRFGSETTIEKKTGSRKVAHDSGDGETIYHCPFCGAGQVTARSDGTAECGFCQTSFTVQVQPSMSAVPQTIDGVPHVHPDMPGSDPGTTPDEVAPEDQEVETPLTSQEQEQGGIFASRRTAAWGPPRAGEVIRDARDYVGYVKETVGRYEDGWVVIADRDLELIPGDGVVVYPHSIESSNRVWTTSRGQALDDRFSAKRYFLTASGVALPEDAYLKHLAIQHADDRQAVIAAVRAERQDRG